MRSISVRSKCMPAVPGRPCIVGGTEGGAELPPNLPSANAQFWGHPDAMHYDQSREFIQCSRRKCVMLEVVMANQTKKRPISKSVREERAVL